MRKSIITINTNITELRDKIDQVVVLMKEIENFEVKIDFKK